MTSKSKSKVVFSSVGVQAPSYVPRNAVLVAQLIQSAQERTQARKTLARLRSAIKTSFEA